MAGVGLPLYGHCTYTRRTLGDGSSVETFNRGWVTKSIISIQGEPSSEVQSLWAGDREEETARGGVTGTKSVVLSRLPLKREAELNGAHYDEARDEMIEEAIPNPPYCRSGGIEKLMEDGEIIYQVLVYMSVKYGPVADNPQTANQTPAFQNKTLSGQISANANGIPRIKRNFKGEGAFDRALAYFYELLYVPAPLGTPTATPEPGEVAADTAVELTAAENVEIRYTTNGLDVTMSNGILYEGAIPIKETTTIKARAYDPAGERSSSPQFTGVYTVAGAEVEGQAFSMQALTGLELGADAYTALKAELAGMTKEQLADFAAQSGYVVSKNDIKDAMVQDILNQMLEEALPTEMQGKGEAQDNGPDVEEG